MTRRRGAEKAQTTKNPGGPTRPTGRPGDTAARPIRKHLAGARPGKPTVLRTFWLIDTWSARDMLVAIDCY
eukprot:3152653-Lingulodinium_polyedra.AAC.1